MTNTPVEVCGDAHALTKDQSAVLRVGAAPSLLELLSEHMN